MGLVTKMVNGYYWKYKDKWNNESILNLFYLLLPFSQRGENLGSLTKMVNGYHGKYKDKWDNESILFYSICIYYIVKEG